MTIFVQGSTSAVSIGCRAGCTALLCGCQLTSASLPTSLALDVCMQIDSRCRRCVQCAQQATRSAPSLVKPCALREGWLTSCVHFEGSCPTCRQKPHCWTPVLHITGTRPARQLARTVQIAVSWLQELPCHWTSCRVNSFCLCWRATGASTPAWLCPLLSLQESLQPHNVLQGCWRWGTCMASTPRQIPRRSPQTWTWRRISCRPAMRCTGKLTPIKSYAANQHMYM